MIEFIRMSKYLILKVGALGDLSFFLPVIDQLKKKDPKAQVTWIVGRTYAEFLEKHPAIDHLIAVDEKRLFLGSPLQRLHAILQLWCKVGWSYQAILVGHRTLGAFLLLRFRVFGRFFQIVRRPSRLLSLFRTEVVIPPLQIQESLAFKQMTEHVLQQSIADQDWVWNSDWVSALSPFSSLKKDHLPLVCVHIGGGSNAKTEFQLKKWPYWKEFLELVLKSTSAQVVLVGAPSERSEAEELMSSWNSWQGRIENRVGKTQVSELISLLKSASCFVGVDSGPLHFADSMGVVCVGIYGPTSPVSWGLLGSRSQVFHHQVPCSPCYRDDGVFPECAHEHVCMKSLKPEELMQKVQNLLKNE